MDLVDADGLISDDSGFYGGFRVQFPVLGIAFGLKLVR